MKNTLLNCSIAQLFKRKPASPNRGEQCNNGTMQQSNQGFTLIELLVTIAIIGLLATFLIPNYIETRLRSRDAQRKSDLRVLQTALEAYYNDHGEYPAVPDDSLAGVVLPTPLANYLRQFPRDPLENTASVDMLYHYDNVPVSICGFGGTPDTYRLWAWLENIEDIQGTDDCGDRNSRSFNGDRVIYTVLSP